MIFARGPWNAALEALRMQSPTVMAAAVDSEIICHIPSANAERLNMISLELKM